jgi:hypothetical protein
VIDAERQVANWNSATRDHVASKTTVTSRHRPPSAISIAQQLYWLYRKSGLKRFSCSVSIRVTSHKCRICHCLSRSSIIPKLFIFRTLSVPTAFHDFSQTATKKLVQTDSDFDHPISKCQQSFIRPIFVGFEHGAD